MTPTMAALNSQIDNQSGTRENLTPSQNRALYRLWHRFLRLCEMPAGSLSGGTATTSTIHKLKSTKSGEQISSSSQEDNLSRRKSLQPLKPNANVGTQYGKPLQRQSSNVREIDERGSHIPKDDRVKDELKTLEEAKEMREFLEKYGGDRLREIFWEMVKGEHPDAVMLRFLRARKWDIDRAIAVIGSTAAFRADNDVSKILKGGELALTSTRGGMNLLGNGISYIYGATSIGEPIYFVEVSRHFSHNQTQQELKKGIIFLQEILQQLMPPPIERKVVIFNMNDFGIRNMDWWAVFFMVKTMESYYVETLSRVYVHGAPWIFKPIWAILAPLLDPVVREKIRLTFSAEELAEHIPFHHLPKESMRGGMDWKFDYPRPDPQENDIQKDEETKNRLYKEYMIVAKEFERATKEVATLYARASILQRQQQHGALKFHKGLGLQNLSISSDEEENSGGITSRNKREKQIKNSDLNLLNDDGLLSAATAIGLENDTNITSNAKSRGGSSIAADDMTESLKAHRDVLATKLRVAFLRLRPYIVGKSMLDRWNVVQEDGRIIWKYKSIDGKEEEQILGLGTTLPELEKNLEIVEQAQAEALSAEVGNFSQDQKRNSNIDLSANGIKTPNSPSSPKRDLSPKSPSTIAEMNRRQQRLQHRSRPSQNLDEELNQTILGTEVEKNEIIQQEKSMDDIAKNSKTTTISPSTANIKDTVPVHPLSQQHSPN